MIKPMKKRIFGQLLPTPVKGSILMLADTPVSRCRFLVKAVSDDIDDVVIGDTVLLKKHAGTEIDQEGEAHLIVKYEDVLGIFEGV